MDWERYEDFLGEFVERYPAMFWQFNFMSAAGAIALGWLAVSALLRSAREVPPALVLAGVLILSFASAWSFQKKYRKRARK